MNDYRDKFNFTWISKRLTLVIFNVTAAYDKSKGKFICEFTTSQGGWRRLIQVKIVGKHKLLFNWELAFWSNGVKN